MGLFNILDKVGAIDKIAPNDKTANLRVKSPRELYGQLLKGVSGAGETRKQNFEIFYEIVAFKGVMDGVGCSTLVANVAKAIADLGLKICVVDTSIKHPVQDILLNTDYKNRVPDEKNRLDWFDMPYTKQSVLHESKVSSGISVLSFYGKSRGIIDILSTNDNPELVDIAFTELHNKFDLILVDCCDEDTSVNTAALQQSQQVIQVWTDTTTVVNNIDNFINNSATLSCPLDKMRNVVYSQIMDDIIGNLDDMLNQYRLTKLATNTYSKDVRRVSVLGKPLYQYVSNDPDIIEYTECIIQIVCHILNIHDVNEEPVKVEPVKQKKPEKTVTTEDIKEAKGIVTSQDILDGKVEGTYHKELKDFNDKLIEETGVVGVTPTTAEAADASLKALRDGIPAASLVAEEDNSKSSETKDIDVETEVEESVEEEKPQEIVETSTEDKDTESITADTNEDTKDKKNKKGKKTDKAEKKGLFGRKK